MGINSRGQNYNKNAAIRRRAEDKFFKQAEKDVSMLDSEWEEANPDYMEDYYAEMFGINEDL